MTWEPKHETYDVLIVGLGAFGSAAAYYLASRGVKVCGFDRFAPPHDQGSSHGSSRIIRQAYAEDPLYVPALRRAYELWAKLESHARHPLYTPCGGLMLGHPNSELIEGAQLSARDHGLDCEVLSHLSILERWPGTVAPDPATVGVFDPRAGVLAPEHCIDTFLRLASEAGAELRSGALVATWHADGGETTVRLEDGTRISGRRLLLAAGPWTSELVPEIGPHLQVTRQAMHWFEIAGDRARARPDRFPIFMWEHVSPRIFYGFPDEGEGLKVAIHHEGDLTTADDVDREVSRGEVSEVRHLIDLLLPGLAGSHLRSAVCLYTNTPDGHFLIDRHPTCPEVVVASPCSGHGFKFATALGEALADLLQDRQPLFSLQPFGLDRLDASDRPLTRVRTGSSRFTGEIRQS